MAITADFHLHTNYSTDSEEEMEFMVKRGIELGLTHMCFTEHHDIDFPPDPNYQKTQTPFSLNTDSYLYEILMQREKYGDKINIMFGVEVGVQPHLKDELVSYAKSFDFDFLIASTHLVDHVDPYYPQYFEGKTDEEGYRRYFEVMLANLNTFDNFDVLGHLDYIVRYGKSKDEDYSYNKYKDSIDPILVKLVDMGKGLEINTGAVSYHLKELNPCNDIIKRYKELGGEIVTVGSDAHNVRRIADSFDMAANVLKECGFDYYATFEKRKATFHKI